MSLGIIIPTTDEDMCKYNDISTVLTYYLFGEVDLKQVINDSIRGTESTFRIIHYIIVPVEKEINALVF